MFRSKTVLVLGAGSSCEVGMPSGNQLKELISEELNFDFEMGLRVGSGSRNIFNSIRKCQPSKVQDDLFEASQQIRNALPGAVSIDNLIDAHEGNNAVEKCGKISIVNSIMKSEAQSTLLVRQENGEEIVDLQRLQSTWYLQLFMMLNEGIRKSNIENIFDNLEIVTFNYDRTVEHFFMNALRAYYFLSEEAAADLLKMLKIHHAYGKLGSLPWQKDPSTPVVPFGAVPNDLNTSAANIRTFLEMKNDSSEFMEIQTAVAKAESIIFLGFAYHDLNMRALFGSQTPSANKVFGTCYGISDFNQKEILRRLQNFMKDAPGNYKYFLSSSRCASFLEDHRLLINS